MLRGFFLQGFLTLAIAFPLACQVYLPKKAYMHLVGRIDADKEITMNLVKVEDSLYADLVFSGKQCNFSVIAGNVREDGSFTMTYPFCDSLMVFKGHFVNRNSITGTYESIDSAVSNPFVLVESYPEGSIPLRVFALDSTHRLDKSSGSPAVEISQCLIVPGESTNPVISDSLRIRMISSFSNNANNPQDPEKVIQTIQKTFIKNYLAGNESLYKEMPDAGSLNWVLLKYTHILYNDNNLISYYVLDYSYTGGAHGMETNNFTVVNLTTGEVLTLEDIFKPGYEAQLTSLLTSKLKVKGEISPDDKLSDNGYFVDEVIPNSNFYVTANGIGFFYNHYEIAPYANGFTDIMLPYHDLIKILKRDGPLSEFLTRL